MKKILVLAISVMALFALVSCEIASSTNTNDNTGNNSGGEEETDPATSGDFTGTWESFFGDIIILTETTYEKHDSFGGSVTFAERGALSAAGNMFTLVRQDVKPDGTGDWLSADFDSKFERDRTSYNEYLEGFSMAPVDSDGYWDIHYQWAQDEAEGGNTGSPYPGYTAGMTLEEYKTAARQTYTASLTREVTYEIDNLGELAVTDDGDVTYYSPQP